MALDPDCIRLLHPLDLDPMEVADEIARLRAALKPFEEAYRIGAKACKSQTLSDWEAMAKHHTSPGAYKNACFAMASESEEGQSDG